MSIKGTLKRDGVDSEAVSATPTPRYRGDGSGWTKERVAKLKAMWADGLSAQDIGIRLGGFGHTPDNGRSAVLGKVHRLKLPGRAEGRQSVSRRVRKRGSSSPVKPQQTASTTGRPWRAPKPVSRVAEVFNAEPFTPSGPELVIPADERKGLLDLDERECRWPIGDPKHQDFHFCARRKQNGLPYCDHHVRRAYQPIPVRPRKSDVASSVKPRTPETVS